MDVSCRQEALGAWARHRRDRVCGLPGAWQRPVAAGRWSL
jgi:hypothetical protein